MIEYYYGARDPAGGLRSGVIRAVDRYQALNALRDRYPLVLRLDQVGESANPWTRLWSSRIRSDDLLAITHQLAAALESGLGFGATMDILLLDKVHRPAMRKVVVEIAASVNEGAPLSQALADHPRVFSPLYVNLVKAGEESAEVPKVLRELAQYLEREAQIRNDVMTAAVYPLLVLLVGLLVTAATVTLGAPVLVEMYETAGLSLPWYSQLVVRTGAAVAALGWWLLPLSLAFFYLTHRCLRLPPVRKKLWSTALRVGPFKEFLLEMSVARSCRTLAILYSNGTPVLQALKLTASVCAYEPLRKLYLSVAEQVATGRRLSEPFLDSPIFPPMASGMLAAGERSGNLPEMLGHLSSYYERRVDFAIKALSKLLEPVLILLVGLLVGAAVLALGLPFLNLVGVV